MMRLDSLRENPFWSAAACCRFSSASLLTPAQPACSRAKPAGWRAKSGSKLPHSKAPAAHPIGRAQRTILSAVGLALLVLSTAGHARAQESVLELDPAQTQIGFTLGDVLHTVHGMFKLKQGTISFNPATGQAGGLIVVDATSGDSGSHARDRKMHKDVLQSDQYPEITFVPQQVQGQVLPVGDFKVRVLGTFTMHGQSHPLTLIVQANAAGEQLTASVTFSIPYLNWGLKNPSTLLLRVNSTVDIAIQTVGRIRLVAVR